MSVSPEVVIIGAGAVGCATAYFLTKQGIRPVVVERDAIADHASGFAFGGLTPFTAPGRPGPDDPLHKEATRMHAELAEELPAATGIDTAFRWLTHYTLARSEPEATGLRGAVPRLCDEGFPAEWLDGAALRRLEPRFSEQVLGTLRVEGAAMVESYRYTLALAQAAEKGGAEIRHGDVVGLRVEGGRVAGVETRSATIPCRQVVLAAGPWSGPASAWLGVRIPVRPLKGQIVRLRLAGGGLEGRFSWKGSYFATKPDGMTWTGTTEEDIGFDERITDEARDAILHPLAELFPPLLDAEVVQQTACLRPLSADGLPIIGPAPGIEGLWVMTGGGRRGIVLSAVMGRIAAELVATGRTATDIRPFGLERFGA